MFPWVAAAVHVALLGLWLGSPAVTAALLGGYAALHAVVAWGVLHPRSRLFGPNLARLSTDARVVALTFDDGPHPSVTPQVLDVLRAERVRATFFLVGKWVVRHPELVRRIVEEGHEVGNHSYGHSYRFWALSPAKLEREIASTQVAIEAAAGVRCRWFRAPVGMKSPWLRRALDRHGLRLVSWDVRFLDRCPVDSDRLTRRLRRRVRAGSILVLHDGHDRKRVGNPSVVRCLPEIVAALRALGCACVPLSSPPARSNRPSSRNGAAIT